jgi:hypothetical protein
VATLTFLLGLLARKANTIVQALSGWCIAALDRSREAAERAHQLS